MLRTPEETVMVITTAETAVRELDHRTNDGFNVRLLWERETGRVFVTVEDQRRSDYFELEVDPADAFEAFRHPFAYASGDHDVHSAPAQRAT
jgi:hypothetical protein